MSIIISLIIYLIVLGIVWWLVSHIPLPSPFDTIIKVLFIILAVLACLDALGVVGGNYLPRINI